MMREKETKQLETMDGASKTKKKDPEPEVHIQDELPITLPPRADSPPPPSSSDQSKSSEAVASTKEEKKDNRKDAPTLSKAKVDDWEKISDIYNGAEMENYKWSQTITDIDVRIAVPEGTTARDVKVDIRSDYLKVKLLKPKQEVRTSYAVFTDPLPNSFL